MSLVLGKGYCDLNIPIDSNVPPINLVKRALVLGYETLALNVRVHQKELVSKAKQKHQAKKAKTEKADGENSMLDFPDPPKIELKEEDYPDLAAKNRKPVILYRLTITFYSNDFIPFFTNSTTAKHYDLLSIVPESTLALQNLLKSPFKADILCFDPERVKDVQYSRKLYMDCVNRDMFFEIPYSPCIRDSTARRRIIAQSHTYHAVGKSKSIIISSEALATLELRGPHDVANLGFIFGLNEQQGKDAVHQNPVRVVQAAAGRKVGTYRALIQKVDDLPEHEKNKIPDDLSSSSTDGEEDSSGQDEESDSNMEGE